MIAEAEKNLAKSYADLDIANDNMTKIVLSRNVQNIAIAHAAVKQAISNIEKIVSIIDDLKTEREAIENLEKSRYVRASEKKLHAEEMRQKLAE